MILQYLLLLTPLITHLLVDYKGKVRHKLNATYVLLLSIVISLFLPEHWYQGAIYALAIHFTFFDPLYNIMHKKKLFYHGDPRNPNRAWTDKQWEKMPIVIEVFVRLWVLSVGYGIYHHWDWVVSWQ